MPRGIFALNHSSRITTSARIGRPTRHWRSFVSVRVLLMKATLAMVAEYCDSHTPRCHRYRIVNSLLVYVSVSLLSAARFKPSATCIESRALVQAYARQPKRLLYLLPYHPRSTGQRADASPPLPVSGGRCVSCTFVVEAAKSFGLAPSAGNPAGKRNSRPAHGLQEGRSMQGRCRTWVLRNLSLWANV